MHVEVEDNNRPFPVFGTSIRPKIKSTVPEIYGGD